MCVLANNVDADAAAAVLMIELSSFPLNTERLYLCLCLSVCHWPHCLIGPCPLLWSVSGSVCVPGPNLCGLFLVLFHYEVVPGAASAAVIDFCRGRSFLLFLLLLLFLLFASLSISLSLIAIAAIIFKTCWDGQLNCRFLRCWYGTRAVLIGGWTWCLFSLFWAKHLSGIEMPF